MPDHHAPHTTRDPTASLVDAAARAAAFAALAPALDALASQAGTDPRLSIDARRVLRAITGTRPQDTLALTGLAIRASTPKTRVPTALNERHTHGYLARVAEIVPHLSAALPDIDTTPASAPLLGQSRRSR
jgi:hypothetical protein